MASFRPDFGPKPTFVAAGRWQSAAKIADRLRPPVAIVIAYGLEREHAIQPEEFRLVPAGTSRFHEVERIHNGGKSFRRPDAFTASVCEQRQKIGRIRGSGIPPRW